MKKIKLHLRKVSWLFLIIMLSQGCTLYKGSISLENAVANQKKVKVYTSTNVKPYQFKRIEEDNGKYKGIPKRYSQASEVIVKKEDITLIKEHDKTASNIVSFTPLAIIVALGIILFSSEGEN